MQEVNKEIELKDLTLQHSNKKGFVYRFDRSIDYFQKDKQFQIPHISNQEVCFIEDLKDLQKIIELISDSEEIKEWKFLSQWNSLGDGEKVKKYDKYACHELNLFLFVKDKEFFDNVVLQFL